MGGGCANGKENASMRMVRIKLVLWVNSDFRGCIISTYVHMYVSMHECMYVCICTMGPLA